MQMQYRVHFRPGAIDFGVDENLTWRPQAFGHAGDRLSVETDLDHFVFRRVAHARFGGAARADEDAVGAGDARADVTAQRPRQLHLAEHATGSRDADADVGCVRHDLLSSTDAKFLRRLWAGGSSALSGR